MTNQDLNPKKRTRYFCDTYKVTPVTVWRWVQSGKLPKPKKINGKNYWDGDVEPLLDGEAEAA